MTDSTTQICLEVTLDNEMLTQTWGLFTASYVHNEPCTLDKDSLALDKEPLTPDNELSTPDKEPLILDKECI
jgi:hypothetical protein